MQKHVFYCCKSVIRAWPYICKNSRFAAVRKWTPNLHPKSDNFGVKSEIGPKIWTIFGGAKMTRPKTRSQKHYHSIESIFICFLFLCTPHLQQSLLPIFIPVKTCNLLIILVRRSRMTGNYSFFYFCENFVKNYQISTNFTVQKCPKIDAKMTNPNNRPENE
jgi:hypothetical protein